MRSFRLEFKIITIFTQINRFLTPWHGLPNGNIFSANYFKLRLAGAIYADAEHFFMAECHDPGENVS